jgi:hypothetical protein
MSQQIQKKYYYECPECHSRYFSEPVTLGVRDGTLSKIHPICTNCFEKCPSGHTFGYGENCNVCRAPRRRFNLIRHALDPDDPTFGNTATGSTSYPTVTDTAGSSSATYTPGNTFVLASKITASASGTSVTVGINIATAAGNIRMALYSHNATDDKPASLLGETASIAIAGTDFQDYTLTGVTIVSGTVYWIAFQFDNNGAQVQGVASGRRSFYTHTYGAMDATWSAGSTQDAYTYNLRANYVQIKGYAYTYKFTLNENTPSVTSMSFYVTAGASGHFRNAIYNDSAGVPNALQWESASIAATAGAWNTHNISAGTPTSLSLTAGTYHLGYQWDDVSAGPSYTAGTAGFGQRLQQTYGAFPASWSGGTAVADEWSIYVTYTAPTLTQTHYRWYLNNSAESPTAKATEDVAIGSVASGDVLRLRLAVSVATLDLSGSTFKLQYATNLAGAWTDVDVSSGSGIWRYHDGLGVDKAQVANLLLTGSTVKEHFVESAPSASNILIPVGGQGEWDLCLQNNGAPGVTYFFRLVYNLGGTFSTYSQYPTLLALANAYLYQDLTSVANYVIQAGDYLEYDVYWTDRNQRFAVELVASDGTKLRDLGAVDQNGLSSHPNTDLSNYALGYWYHRKIHVPGIMVGKTISKYDIASESDVPGSYAAGVRDIYITDGAGTVRKTIWDGDNPITSAVDVSSGTTLVSLQGGDPVLGVVVNPLEDKGWMTYTQVVDYAKVKVGQSCDPVKYLQIQLNPDVRLTQGQSVLVFDKRFLGLPTIMTSRLVLGGPYLEVVLSYPITSKEI